MRRHCDGTATALDVVGRGANSVTEAQQNEGRYENKMNGRSSACEPVWRSGMSSAVALIETCTRGRSTIAAGVHWRTENRGDE